MCGRGRETRRNVSLRRRYNIDDIHVLEALSNGFEFGFCSSPGARTCQCNPSASIK